MDSRTGISDSNDMSGSSSICCITNTGSQSPEPSTADVAAMTRLSENLESVFLSAPDFDFYADAKIAVADGRVVPVHRCILSARSPFFKKLFTGKGRGVKLELKSEEFNSNLCIVVE